MSDIIIKGIDQEEITLNIGGEVRKIQNELAALKQLLEGQSSQQIQYADKIYNIGHIDEANFGFLTGKRAFNEHLTRQLMTAIRPHSSSAQVFLERVAHIEGWESQLNISNKAKEVIAYSFVGVIGIQISKLMAIGKEDFSEGKQRKYIEKCLHVAKRSLDLINFALLSAFWDNCKAKGTPTLGEELREALTHRFDDSFEPTVLQRRQLTYLLCRSFQNNGWPLPVAELSSITDQLAASAELDQIAQAFQELDNKLGKSKYDLLDCFEAEKQLAMFFHHFHFLANYSMASIKKIAYLQGRNAEPHYLHRYAALGIDSKANVNAEKVNYTPQAVYTDAVLLYQDGDYRNGINLFPFVIDYNALAFEQGAKICFYRCQSLMDGMLEYVFLEDNSVQRIERRGVLQGDTDYNQLMMDEGQRSALNLDTTVDQFKAARRCLLGGDALNFDDL